jgi:protocatechuate 3,4-dioxygenase beta subunit
MRRAALGIGSIVVVSFSAVAFAAAPPETRPAHEAGPCATASAQGRVTPDGEPGTPLVVRGHVFLADGVTPAAGVILYVYHTDATGVYNRGEGPPRLRAWLRTDSAGAYEYRTIRPAAYPGRTVPAHIHTQVWGHGVPAQYGPELEFDDDPLLGATERQSSEKAGRFAWILRPEKRSGVLEVTHDIRLESGGTTFEDNTAHGFDACR